MTLTELERLYNFHDCDVFTPFKVEHNSITVTFALAKHLQYDNLKSYPKDLTNSKHHHLIVTVKFSDCSSLQVCEWTYRTSKSATKAQKHDEKIISLEQFDSDMDFISLATSDHNNLCFVFEGDGNSKKISEIQFSCDNIEVIEEKFVDTAEYEKLWEEFEAI